jgi:multidrug efflux pump
MQPVQDLTVEDRVTRTQFQYSLEDPDGARLNRWAPRVVDALRALPELRDVSSDQQDRGLGTALEIDRGTASRLGITPQAVDDALYDAFGQRPVSTTFTQVNQYRVILEVKPGFREDPSRLRDIYLASAGGGQVPLGTVARWSDTTSALALNRQGQFPAVTLSFNLAPGASLGAAVRRIDALIRDLGMPASIQGTASRC